MKQARTVAVIVPVLNEIKALPGLLVALGSVKIDEIIFVDGGSRDGSYEWLANHPATSLTLLRSEKGRALQMNTGAMASSADVLLFLHADSSVSNDMLAEVQQARWGRFDVNFHDNHTIKPKLLDFVAYMINLRSRISGVATGDQAMFVERRLFDDVGGFPLVPIMEDVVLSKKLRKIVRPYCSTVTVGTSARRWQKNGVWRTILLMWGLRFAHVLGVPPQNLHRVYRQVR